jgi:hypothetical protein
LIVSTPLNDFRGKITIETHVALEALSRATGRDRAEIARDVLHRWASEQLYAASVMQRLATAEGVTGDYAGIRREHEGLA